MANDRSRLLERAEHAKRESKTLDFKRELDTASPAEWSEIVKDIVAFANSGGGVIVFGVNNDGTSARNDIPRIPSIDIADITNKIEAFTGFQFADLEIAEVSRMENFERPC
jgi:predicted HTH transcriptional regulator